MTRKVSELKKSSNTELFKEIWRVNINENNAKFHI